MKKLMGKIWLMLAAFGAMHVQAQDSENVILLDNWHDESIETIDLGMRYNEVWGFVQDDEEYAVIGSKIGTHFFHITDSDELDEVAFVPGAFQGYVVHRDYHDYEGYLYGVCDQGQSTLQIMDLSGLPDTVTVVYDSDEHVVTAHNVFIDSSSAKLYLAGPQPNALRLLSVENPTEPEYLFDFLQVNYVHDLFVRNDTAWLNCASQGLQVVDFSEGFPVSLGSLTTYPDQGYNHSGWANDDASIYVLADENDGLRMKVCDVSDLSNIEVLSLFGSEESDNSVPHNLQIKGDYVYVSHYNDGLQVFDISDPENPVRAAYYDTFTGDEFYSFNGAWGIYAFLPSGRILISDRTNGLFLFDVDLTTSIADHQMDQLKISLFPNPTRGQVTIETDLPQIESVLLYNFTGQLVTEQPVGQWYAGGPLNFDWSDLPAGMYVVEVRGGDAISRANLIVY